jgi:NADH dehydrogenase
LILELEGASRPFLHLPVPLCRALAGLLARVMKDPPLTPYAVAGFTHDADLDCGLAMADLGYAPRGVRAGLSRCIPAPAAARATTPDPAQVPPEIRRAT